MLCLTSASLKPVLDMLQPVPWHYGLQWPSMQVFTDSLVCVTEMFCRQCAGLVDEGDVVYEALLPSGPLTTLVLKYVWALWEDPVDVSFSPIPH